MNTKRMKKLILSALFAALVCVATMVIHIPSSINGYINLGDCFVLLSGWLLGPWFGFLAGGLGSALADLFLGYPYYVPGTFLIKGLVALLACLVSRSLTRLFRGHARPARIFSGLIAEAFMVLGYFAYAGALLGEGFAAAADIPGNLLQGAAGMVLSLLLIALFERLGLIKTFFSSDS